MSALRGLPLLNQPGREPFLVDNYEMRIALTTACQCEEGVKSDASVVTVMARPLINQGAYVIY